MHKENGENYPQDEREAIEVLKDYLGESILDTDKLTRISTQVYDRYVAYDDEYVTKAIRRVMVIYAQRKKKNLNDAIMKWRLNSIRCPILIKEDNCHQVSPIRNYNNNRIKVKKISNQRYTNSSHNNKKNSIKNKKQTEINLEIDLLPSYRNQITNEATFTIRNNKTLKPKDKGSKKCNNTSNTSPNHIYYHKLSVSPFKQCKNISQLNNTNTEIIPVYKSTLNKEEKEQLFASLYNDSKLRKEKIKQMNIEKEQKFNSEYTFTPQLKAKGNSSSLHIFNTTAPFIERLQAYDQTKKNNLQRICQDIIDNSPKPKQCKLSQEPHLITNGKDYRKAQKEKRRKIEELILEEQGITFKPILNDERNSRVSHSVIERNRDFIKKKEAKLEACRDEPDRNCTFKPIVNTIGSSSSMRNTDPNGSSNDQIGKRLYQYQSKYLQNLEFKKKEYEEQYSFKPIISKNTDEILYNKQRLSEEMKKKYGDKIIDNNPVQYQDIKEEGSQNETEENNNNYVRPKNNNLNINTINSEDTSLNNSPIAFQEKERKRIAKDDDNTNHNEGFVALTEEYKTKGAIFSVKGDNTSQKKTKVTSSTEKNLNEDKRSSEEKYQAKTQSKIMSNAMPKNKPMTIFEENEGEREMSSNRLKANTLMKNMGYYDNL